jgi:hypothetical protein
MIAKELPSLFFEMLTMVCGALTLIAVALMQIQVFTLAVVLLWLLVAARTMEKSIKGTLFFAPCVKGYEETRRLSEAKVAEIAAEVV